MNDLTTAAKCYQCTVKGDGSLRTRKEIPTVNMLTTELLLLTGLTKLPVADCHLKRRCYPFCLGLQLQRVYDWAGVPQGSISGPQLLLNTCE